MQYIITQIQNVCQLAILGRINFNIKLILPITVVQGFTKIASKNILHNPAHG